MNELTTDYWEILYELEFIYKYFLIQNIKILGINRSSSFVVNGIPLLFSDLFGLLHLSAVHRICIPRGALISAAHTLNRLTFVQSYFYYAFYRCLLIVNS